MRTNAKIPAVAMGALLMGCGALVGCTDTTDPPSSGSSPPSPSASASVSTDAQQFEAHDAAVATSYPDRSSAGTFSGNADDVITVPAASVEGQTAIVMVLTCTGTGDYSITVDQEHPNTVGASCGDAGLAVASVPLDDPASAQTLNVSIPSGSQYWLSTYYAEK